MSTLAPRDTLTALATVLEQARHQSRVAALALADAQGLLIAGAGRFATCEALSAEAPLLRNADLTCPFELGKERVLLCASAPLNDRKLVAQLVQECRRILAPVAARFV
jgi:hypothetical protein